MPAHQNISTEPAVKIFEDDKLYGQPEFTARGCGGKTRWWKHVKNGDFRFVKVGLLTKATGSSLNAYFSK
jgi:hypothetical protein